VKYTSIKKILVPLDGSRNSLRGLDMAIFLARQCRATITGVYSHNVRPTTEFPTIQSLQKKVPKQVTAFLEGMKTKAAKKGVIFNYAILKGSPEHTIIKMAHRKKFDIIVIGSRGHGSARGIFFGSVSHNVLHKSKIPVLIVK